MSSYTNQLFTQYNKNKENFAEIYNHNTNEGIKHLTGLDEQHAAWRYSKIHGAVELMGGWANCSYWIQNHAANYFQTCEKLETLINRLINNHLPKLEREQAREQLARILKDMK